MLQKNILEKLHKLLFSLVFYSTLGLSAMAQIPNLGNFTASAPVNVSELKPGEVDAYLATLTDKEAREVLLAQIKTQVVEAKDTPDMMADSYSARLIMNLHEGTERFETGLADILASREDYPDAVELTTEVLFNQSGVENIPKTLVILFALLAFGALVVTIIFRKVSALRNSLRLDGNYPIYTRLARSASGLLLDGLKIALFIVVTVPLTYVFYDKFDPLRVLASSTLLFVATIWVVRAVLREVLFSPVSREIFMANEQHRKTYYWSVMGTFVLYIFVQFSSTLLQVNAFPSELIRLNIVVLAGATISFLLLGIIVDARRTRQQRKSLGLSSEKKMTWHVPIFVLLILIFLMGVKNIIIGEAEQGHFGFYVVVMILLMPIYTRVVTLLMSTSPEIEPYVDNKVGQNDPDISLNENLASEVKLSDTAKLSGLTRLIFGLPYLTLMILFFMEALGVGIVSWASKDGGDFWQSAIRAVLAIVIGMITWNILRNIIRRNMSKISLDPNALMDGEGGGSDAATRTQTLLPILQNVSFFFIVVIVIFVVLSALGVNTGPLLAGAGVIGIAIGFGAQKLVQDIVSGLFFLFEDAFRIGEYIQAGDMVGTVESTSLRSLKLRHHLGAVQTIPYGEIRAVKNLSRDFVIMKLKFRVPFDTDIELVRKTIKKVGIALLDHDELGGDFIAPLKSQGVQTAEDDALVIRMKFTCLPGKQWMIKREAYRLVQEALAQKGINFASRQVTVHIPNQENLDEKTQQQVAGAAFAATEEKKDAQKPVDPLADL